MAKKKKTKKTKATKTTNTTNTTNTASRVVRAALRAGGDFAAGAAEALTWPVDVLLR